jgi:hypothetical protein
MRRRLTWGGVGLAVLALATWLVVLSAKAQPPFTDIAARHGLKPVPVSSLTTVELDGVAAPPSFAFAGPAVEGSKAWAVAEQVYSSFDTSSFYSKATSHPLDYTMLGIQRTSIIGGGDYGGVEVLVVTSHNTNGDKRTILAVWDRRDTPIDRVKHWWRRHFGAKVP